MPEPTDTQLHLGAEEQDRRLETVTAVMREERLRIEQENLQLQSLVTHYLSVVERLESELAEAPANTRTRAQIKDALRDLAERSTAVAAAL